MFIILAGVYSFLLVLVLGFFTIIKINAYKFKALNSNIEGYTKTLFALIVLLTVLWFGLIFYYKHKTETKFIDKTKTTENIYY